MASGKKGKKTKGKTLALTDFLQETPGSLPTQPIRKSTTSWADEIDDYDSLEPKILNVALPTAPKASRDYEDIADKVPKEPPFVAYLSNLPYDVDEDEIAEFFKNLKISSMRIPKDDRSGEAGKLKGYGYVEFEDRDSLLSALIIPDTNLKNRRIRIEVATNAENDRRRGGRMGMGMGDRMGDTGGDWRSSNRPEPVDDRRGGGSSSGGFSREGMRESGGRERDYGGFNRERDSGFSRDFGRERDGFSRNREQDDRPWREGERSNRDSNRDRGFSRPSYRDTDRNRFDNDRDDRDRRGGGFRRYDDREERNGGFTRSNNRDDRDDKEPELSSSETRQRPKLQLAPRTKPLEQASASASEPAAPSIFGNAKPVDTTERERQIEEKLRKEQEERLREGSRDRKDKERGTENASDGRNLERGRAILRRDDKERDSEERDVSSKDRRDESKEDSERNENSRTEDRSPENKKRNDKPEKPKREEKRDRPEKELPKFQEPEPPNFQGSNKFAILDDNSD